jgi:hypothetical protein
MKYQLWAGAAAAVMLGAALGVLASDPTPDVSGPAARTGDVFGGARYEQDDVIYFRNKDELRGKVLSDSVTVTTPYGAVKLPLKLCAGLLFASAPESADAVSTINSNLISGRIEDRTLRFRVAVTGAETALPVENISVVALHREPGEPGLVKELGDGDLFIMANGDVLTCLHADHKVTVHTSYGIVPVTPASLRDVVLGDVRSERAVVRTIQGDVLQGAVELAPQDLKLELGPELKGLSLAKFSEIVVSGARQEGPRAYVDAEWTLGGGPGGAKLEKLKVLLDPVAPIKPDEVAGIAKAMPRAAAAQPRRPRRLLVFSQSKGFYHDSIPVCIETLRQMGEATGAFEPYFSTNTQILMPENLRAFDAIFMNNTVGDPFSDETLKKSFVDFVKNGRGVAGLHAAADCSHPWAEYFNIIGGEFTGHPWGKVVVKNEDPKSPLLAMYGGQGFTINEEIYTFKPTSANRPEGYSRQRLHILLSVDLDASGFKDTTRKDGDYALSWIHRYGNGRVFYTAFGHRHEVFQDPAFLAHLLAGIQYALGDLRAPDDPSRPPDPAAPAKP